MDASTQNFRRTGWTGAADTAITAWAVFGGFMVVAVVLMNVWSVIGAIVGLPFGGVAGFVHFQARDHPGGAGGQGRKDKD